jgi:hypothetical protein
MKQFIILTVAFLIIGCSGTFDKLKKYYESQTPEQGSYYSASFDKNDPNFPFIHIILPLDPLAKAHCEEIAYLNENALTNLARDTTQAMVFYKKIVYAYLQIDKDMSMSEENRTAKKKLFQPYFSIASAAVDTLNHKFLTKLESELRQGILFQSQGDFIKAIIAYRSTIQHTQQSVGNNLNIESQCSDSIKSCFNLLRTKHPIDFNKLDSCAVKYDSLNKIASKFNLFDIVGEIKDRDEKRLILWGRAIPVNGDINALGSQLEEGNIVIYDYKQNGISINFYKGRHVYKEKTYGSNAFGGIVGAYAYGNSSEYQNTIEEMESILLLRKQVINSLGLSEVIQQ